MNKQDALSKIDELLKPYLYLDKTKTNGLDMRFKFSNMGLGVSTDTVKFLQKLTDEVSAWQLTADERLKITDVLVLYSNHVDQQNDYTINAKLELNVKESLVISFLDAAQNVFGKKPEHTKEHARALSTYAQLSHYYGKALRYKKMSLEKRTEILQDALDTAVFLEDQKLADFIDPHQYIARRMTYEMPLVFSYQQSSRFDDALKILFRQKNSAPDNFHKAQALIQLAQTYRLKQKSATGIDYAKEAMLVARTEKTLIQYNAKQALMECYANAGYKDEAFALANRIIADQLNNSSCGAQDSHIKAANGIIEELNIVLEKPKI